MLSMCGGPTSEAPHLEAVPATAVSPSWYQPPPVAERFGGDWFGPDGWTFAPTFTPDLRTAYVVRWDRPDISVRQSTIQVLHTTRWSEAGGWSTPTPVPATAGWRVDAPHVAPDGQRLFISYTRPHPEHYGYPDPPQFDDFDLWVADRRPGASEDVQWGPFRPVEGDVNRTKTPANARIRYVHNETGPRTDRAGRLYFWTERLDDGGGWRDLYVAEPDSAGGWGPAMLLPVNTPRRESGLAVDPDGRWIVFTSDGRGGAGGSDLFLSVRDGDGWSEPRSLGPLVNSPFDDGGPEVTADGRTLFFSSDRPVEGLAPVATGEGRARPPWQAYWVDLTALDVFQEETRSLGTAP